MILIDVFTPKRISPDVPLKLHRGDDLRGSMHAREICFEYLGEIVTEFENTLAQMGLNREKNEVENLVTLSLLKKNKLSLNI